MPTSWNWGVFLLQYGGIASLAAVAGYGIFQFTGKKWIEGYFAKALEEFKSAKTSELESLRHSYNQEIEDRRFEIARLMDRTTKLHHYEFESLPVIWDRLTRALSATSTLVSSSQRYPSIKRMGSGELDDFLEKSSLSEWEKSELRECADFLRDDKLIAMIKWQRLKIAERNHKRFQNYYIERSIFLTKGFQDLLSSISNMNYDAFSEHRLDLQLGETDWNGRFKSRDLFNANWQSKMIEVRLEIEERLGDGLPPLGLS